MLETSNTSGFSRKRVQVGPWPIDVRGTFNDELPALVLVHGIGVSSDYFMPFASALSQTHNVVVPDLPGYGGAPKPARPLTVAQLADVLIGLVSVLGLDAPIMVGHSMGSQIVVDLVKNHPSMCSKYILLGPTVDHDARTVRQQAWRLFQDTLREPARVNTIILFNYLRMGPANYLRTLGFMLQYRTEDSIGQCVIPGLVVRGERDPISRRGYAQGLARAAPMRNFSKSPARPM